MAHSTCSIANDLIQIIGDNVSIGRVCVSGKGLRAERQRCRARLPGGGRLKMMSSIRGDIPDSQIVAQAINEANDTTPI